jgi:DNA-binding MarR family transcriptional regulator
MDAADDAEGRGGWAAAERSVDLLGALRELLHGVDRTWHALAARAGMGMTDVITVELLYAADAAVPTAQVRRRTGLTGAAVTSLVDRLEERGLARRIRLRPNRRVVHIELTPAGRELAGALFGPAIELVRQGSGDDPNLPDLETRVRCVRYTADLLNRIADQVSG